MSHLTMLERDSALRKVVMTQKDVALVDVTAATDWFFQESNQEHWDIAEDMHRLTLPAEKTWMEYVIPPYSLTPEGKFPLPRIFERAGMSMVGIQIEPDEESFEGYLIEDFISHYLMGGELGNAQRELYNSDEWQGLRAQSAGYFKANPPRFLIGGALFVQYGNGRTELRTVFAMYLTEEGRCYPAPYHKVGALVWSPQLMVLMNEGTVTPQEAAKIEVAGLLPFMFALSLMNCNNVTLEPAQRRVQRHERRQMERKGEGLIEYKWLTVQKLRRRVDDDAAKAGGEHAGRKFHMVKSNWATYTAEKPLFGKYKGVFWRPQSWRGDLSQGTVVKGYTLPPGPPEKKEKKERS